MIKDLIQPVLYPVPWKRLWPGFEIRQENLLKIKSENDKQGTHKPE